MRTTPEPTGESRPALPEGVPEWSGWIPADALTGEASLFGLDTDRMRETFPEQYSGMAASGLSESWGFEQSDMDHLVGIQSPDATQSLEVLIGSFDPDALPEDQSVADSNIETYEGFDFVEEEKEDIAVALDDSTLVFAPGGDGVRRAIDARLGGMGSIADSEDWRRLLEEGAGSISTSLTSGTFGYASSFEVDRQMLTLSTLGEGRVETGVWYLFESETRAEETLKVNREEMTDHARGRASGTVESVERDGRTVVVRIESEGYPFGSG